MTSNNAEGIVSSKVLAFWLFFFSGLPESTLSQTYVRRKNHHHSGDANKFRKHYRHLQDNVRALDRISGNNFDEVHVKKDVFLGDQDSTSSLPAINNDFLNEGEQGIRGGNAIAPLPWYAVFQTNTLCGASLIWGDILLTASHCVDDNGLPQKVRVGSNDYFTGGTVVEVTDGVLHPGWTWKQPSDPDLAVLKLNTFLPNQVAELNLDAAIPVDSHPSLFAMGFGLINDYTSSRTLLGASLPYREDCSRQSNTYEQKRHVCADAQGVATCGGDSGSPIMLSSSSNVQVGINSYSNGGCTSQTIDVYTRVSYYQEWIEKQVCALSDYPPPYCNPTTDAPTTNAPTTEAPTTVAPTTEAPTTESPSLLPSDLPSVVPSTIPSAIPTATPSNNPTFVNATNEPTLAPSSKPSRTRAPSVSPVTSVPTTAVPNTFGFPTASPEPGNYTESHQPSLVDSAPPSSVPSTNEPTNSPSQPPTTQQPSTVEPTTQQPSTVEPTTQQPSTVEPTTQQPSTVAPTTQQPSTVEPTTQQPSTVEPTQSKPETKIATTIPPTTLPPATVQPTPFPTKKKPVWGPRMASP